MELLTRLQIQSLNPGAYCGAHWNNGCQGESITSYNPANAMPIAQVVTASLSDYQHIIAASEQAFLTWRCFPAPRRGDIIRQIADKLRANKQDLASLISLEMGKSLEEALGEVQEMIDIADFAVGQSRMLYGKTMHSERPNHRLYEQWHPLGIVGVISAFNFPVAVWAWNAFIAAICGNVTIWKPSSKTPLCAIAVHKLCASVLQKNQCPDIFSVIIQSQSCVVDELVNDKRVPLISFTGSTPVGKTVAMKVAARLGKSILELGGNNAIILDETADLKLAIPAIVFAAVGTAGQRCTTTRRLLVHDTCYSQVLALLKQAYSQITIGNPQDANNLMGPLIDSEAVHAYERVLKKIKKAGGVIEFGGDVLKQPGYYVTPTLVTGLTHDCELVLQETFAPILYMMPYKDLAEAVLLQNCVPQGLSSALFTTHLQRTEFYLSAEGSDCGIANINLGTAGAEVGGAFGGEKETGGGRESGSDAWKFYMRRQTTTINWGQELPLAQGIKFSLSEK